MSTSCVVTLNNNSSTRKSITSTTQRFSNQFGVPCGEPDPTGPSSAAESSIGGEDAAFEPFRWTSLYCKWVLPETIR